MTGIEIALAAASVVGGAVSAMGSIQSANAQQASANYNASVMEMEAQASERNRSQALAQSEAEQDDQRRENRRTLSSIRAAYGASGLDLAGTPLDVLGDSAQEGEYDVAKIKYQGDVRAAGYTDEANSKRSGAVLSRAEGKAAKTAGTIGAASQLIGGFTNAGKSLIRTK